MDVQYGLSNSGGAEELPSGGMSGTRGDEDSNLGTLFPLAFLGYYGHFVRGKPLPPPTVPPLRHFGSLVFSKQETHCHIPVLQGGGTEAKVDSGGGTVGDLGEGLSGLW